MESNISQQPAQSSSWSAGADEGAVAASLDRMADNPKEQRRTLMIVDDEDGPRQSLRVVFKDDYNLLMANDGHQAIELARRSPVDVVISDIRMGGMSGVELLERLKSIDPGIEVIMLTAYETADTLRQALRLGACDYLNKPFNITAMRAAVANAMERRSLFAEIANNMQQLEQLQSELQNQRMQEEMSRTKGEIYASIIHDINGPLTVISGFIQLMNQRIGNSVAVEGEDLEFIKDRLRTITRQVTNCIEISRRYLGFLRPRKHDSHQTGVNQILNDLRDLVRVHPSAKGNKLEIQELDQEAFININGTDLIQILLNLVVNGFQCDSNPHRVSITSQLIDRPVELPYIEPPAGRLIINSDSFHNVPPLTALTVSDDGPGIPDTVMQNIFDPYFTTKAPTQGTGLGLNIVKRLVIDARGALDVSTRLGEGTSFTLYLPTTTS